jgi:hypothetical protein
MNNMEDKNINNNELEQIAPKLSKLLKVNVFKVEDQYFDKLPTMVMDKIHEKKSRKLIIDLSWLLQPKWAVTVAVCFLAVIGGSFLIINEINANKPMPLAEVQQLLNEPVSKDAIIDNVDEDVIIDAVVTSPKPAGKVKKLNTKKSVDKKALEQYILDNVDESSLTDEL